MRREAADERDPARPRRARDLRAAPDWLRDAGRLDPRPGPASTSRSTSPTTAAEPRRSSCSPRCVRCRPALHVDDGRGSDRRRTSRADSPAPRATSTRSCSPIRTTCGTPTRRDGSSPRSRARAPARPQRRATHRRDGAPLWGRCSTHEQRDATRDDAGALVVRNVVTGCTIAMRPELLDAALPFPSVVGGPSTTTSGSRCARPGSARSASSPPAARLPPARRRTSSAPSRTTAAGAGARRGRGVGAASTHRAGARRVAAAGRIPLPAARDGLDRTSTGARDAAVLRAASAGDPAMRARADAARRRARHLAGAASCAPAAPTSARRPHASAGAGCACSASSRATRSACSAASPAPPASSTAAADGQPTPHDPQLRRCVRASPVRAAPCTC
jgi:hypothetical protein